MTEGEERKQRSRVTFEIMSAATTRTFDILLHYYTLQPHQKMMIKITTIYRCVLATECYACAARRLLLPIEGTYKARESAGTFVQCLVTPDLFLQHHSYRFEHKSCDSPALSPSVLIMSHLSSHCVSG